MQNITPVLTPDLASCRVLNVGVRAPSWSWEDLAVDDDRKWLRHPALPFEADPVEMPQPVSGDVPKEIQRISLSLARAITEVLAGLRSLSQLCRVLEEPALVALSAAAQIYRRTPPTVASIRVQATAHGSYEITLRLRRGDGHSAAAYRLDKRRDIWKCTALVVGP